MQIVEHPQGIPLRRSRDVRRRAADVVVDILTEAGVEVIFGLPGGAVAPLYDAFLDKPELNVVTMRMDANSVFAAAAYAQATGKIGVAVVTSGPGILNCMNAIASAQADGLPVLVITGDVVRQRFGQGALQDGSSYGLNIVGMASHITKLAMDVPDATALPAMFRRAMATAMSGKRGPVLLNVPVDVLREKITTMRGTTRVSTQFELDEDALQRAAKALNAGDRKLIFAGSGTRFGRGPDYLRAVAERLQAPVMTTPKAKGVFPEDHPLSLGVYGVGGHPSALEFVEEGVDTMLVLGSSLGELATNGWAPQLAARRCFIQVDIDATRMGRVYSTDVPVVAPIEQFLGVLIEELEPTAGPSRYGIRENHVPEAVGDGLTARQAIKELQACLPMDTIYTTDSGNNFLHALHHLRLNQPDSYLALFGLASMGTSIPAAIAAQIAHPTRRVVAIVGDGGFLMCASELAVAAQQQLPIAVLVLNDSCYSIVEQGLKTLFQRTASFPTGPIDIPSLAQGLGVDCLTVIGHKDIQSLDFSNREKPLVIDVRLSNATMIAAGKRFITLSDQLD